MNRARPDHHDQAVVLAVEDEELEAARTYAEAVGGEEVDLRGDPWFSDDPAGGFVVDGGRTLDAMGVEGRKQSRSKYGAKRPKS